jgi:putative membrane protein
MNVMKQWAVATVVMSGLVGLAQAQTPPADGTGPTPRAGAASSDPGSASTPHQHEATNQDQDKDKAMKGSKMADASGAAPATFVKKAALGGMTEVEAAKVAQSKAQDAKVKAFADRMVKDHGKANTELAAIAKGKGLEVPMALDTEHQAMVKELSGKSGAEFDAAYSQHMVKDHAKTIALFEGAAKSSDAELAAFAKKTLPIIKEHKQLADALPGASR